MIHDILVSVKILGGSFRCGFSDLSKRLMRRDLLAIELQNEPFPEKRVVELKNDGETD